MSLSNSQNSFCLKKNHQQQSVPVLWKVMTNFSWYFSFSCLSSRFPLQWMVLVSRSRKCQVNETAQQESLLGNSNKTWRIGFLIRNNKSFLSGEYASSGHLMRCSTWTKYCDNKKEIEKYKEVMIGSIIHLGLKW